MQQHDFCSELIIRLGGRPVGIQNETDFFASAVIVPLVGQTGDLGVLFEVRSAQLAWQPGEICFPGGRIEYSDVSPQAAAVRETCEELGLPSSGLQVLGQLDHLVSPIGVIIYPFVGYITDPEAIKPSSDEVAKVFVVPLKFLLNNEPIIANMEVATKPLPGFPFDLLPANYPREWRRRATYPVLFYHYQDYAIWGLTARMLFNFAQICRQCGIE